MIKKSILQFLTSIVVIFTLTIACVLIIVNINPEKENSLYELNVTNNGLIQTIAYHLVKPVIESAFDSYIEKNGLKDYLREIKQHTEAERPQNFHDITKGTGNEAFCGQKVSLQIHKNNFPSLFVEDVTLEIGKDTLKELSLGVIGMREEGERVVLANNNSYYVKLLKVHDVYLYDPIMIFDNLVNKTGKSVRCGDEVLVKYSIKKHNGILQVENQILKFIVGNKQVPLGIELGVIGMRAGNNRAIIASPDALTTSDNMLIDEINFDKENISIINLSLETFTQ